MNVSKNVPDINVLHDWLHSIGLKLTNSRVMAFGADNLTKITTPKEYLGLDTNKHTVYNHGKTNRCSAYKFGHCQPSNILKIARPKPKWDYVWSCNKIQELIPEHLDICLNQLLGLSNQVILSIKFGAERDQSWWINKLRQKSVIEHYSIKSGPKMLCVVIRPKNYRDTNIFRSLAIIGNSNKDSNSNKGPKIDSFLKVARMNNYILNSNFHRDYGKRTTSWVTSFNHDIEDRDTEDYKHIYCPIPIFNNSMKYKRNRNLELLNKCIDKVKIIPHDYFVDLLKHVSNPSTGLAFLYWVYRENGELNPDQVFGFAFFSPDYTHHYFDDFDKCFHNGDIEEKFYNKMINKQV